MVRVLLVDDHSFVRAAVSALLSRMEGIEVVGECSDGDEVPDVAPGLRPEVVLMDVNMPVVSGLEATRRLTRSMPDVKVLILTGTPDAEGAVEAAEAGASGYLAKGGNGQRLVDAVLSVAAGGTAWPPEFPPS